MAWRKGGNSVRLALLHYQKGKGGTADGAVSRVQKANGMEFIEGEDGPCKAKRWENDGRQAMTRLVEGSNIFLYCPCLNI